MTITRRSLFLASLVSLAALFAVRKTLAYVRDDEWRSLSRAELSRRLGRLVRTTPLPGPRSVDRYE